MSNKRKPCGFWYKEQLPIVRLQACFRANEEPRGKPRGIFVGEEIYYTGGAIP